MKYLPSIPSLCLSTIKFISFKQLSSHLSFNSLYNLKKDILNIAETFPITYYFKPSLQFY